MAAELCGVPMGGVHGTVVRPCGETADGDAFCIQKPVFSMFPQDQHGLPDFPHRGGVGQAGLWGKGDGVHRAVFSLRIGGIAQDKAW